MTLEIEDIDLIEISAIFTSNIQLEVAEIIRENNLTDHLIE